MTAIDFAAIASNVKPAELPASGAGRPRKTENNPFADVVAESWEDFKADRNPGRQITVPGKNSGEAAYLIRAAVEDLAKAGVPVGVRIVLRNGKGEALDAKTAKEYKGNVTILFAAKNRKTKKETAQENTPAEEATSAA